MNQDVIDQVNNVINNITGRVEKEGSATWSVCNHVNWDTAEWRHRYEIMERLREKGYSVSYEDSHGVVDYTITKKVLPDGVARKCQVCAKEIEGETGVTVTTDGMGGKTYFHQGCFDEMWSIYSGEIEDEVMHDALRTTKKALDEYTDGWLVKDDEYKFIINLCFQRINAVILKLKVD